MVSEVYQLKDLSYVPAGLLDTMLDFIASNLPHHAANGSLGFKTKFILTELITNAVKHTADATATLQIELQDKGISIVKIDTGKPLKLNHPDPLSDIIIASDILHTLYAKHQDEQLHFYCVENDDFVLTSNDIPEHFGLLIITKSSDNFYYHHDKETGTNTFNVFVAY